MTNRQYPNRPFCGIGVVVWRGDEVLLVRRARAPRKGDWSIPGGLQELGETVAETALREVREETGVTVRLTGQLGVVDSVRRDDSGRVEYHYTLIEFAAEWVSGEPAPNDDVDQTQWVPADDLDRYALWDETRRIISLSRERRRC
ncbi:MAG: NUDIX hydrolase [Alphaproteobacteria bacterium]